MKLNKKQKAVMDEAYKKQLEIGTITNMDGALGFKLGFESALSLLRVSKTKLTF